MDTKRLLQLPRMIIALFAMIVMMGLQTVGAATIYVSSTTGSDAFNGATPTISGGNGPKQTLAAAYAAATAGDTISIEAGTYTEAFAFATAAKGVTIEVRAAGAVTVATFTGTATFAVTTATITMTGGAGSVAVTGGTANFTSGTVALGAGKLAFTAPTTLNVTGGRASGASPSYTGLVTANYTITAAGSAGTEIPASLNGGTLTVAGGFNTTFPAALAAGSVGVTNTVTTTFSGALSLTGTFTHTGNDVVAADISLTNGSLTTSGAAGQTLTANNIAFAQSANGAFVTNGAGTVMSIANLTVTGFSNNSSGAAPALELFTFTLTNNGTLNVSGAVSDTGAADANDNDSSVIAFTNTGTATFTGAFDIAGGVANGAAGLVTWNSGATVAGVFNSAAIAAPAGVALGANTLTLTGAVALADDFDLGRVTGATSTVSITGSNHLATGNTAGNVMMSGSGDINGAVVVGGALSLLDDNDINGSIDVAGDATLGNAAGDVINFNAGAATNDIDGMVTVGGTVALVAGGAGNAIFGSGSVSSTGSLTINNGATLTLNGDFNTSNGGTFVANAANNSAADNATLAFVLARGTTSTFTAGPNQSLDDVTVTATGASGTATLNLGQSFAVDENFTTGANTAIGLGNFLVRMTGATAAVLVGGSITTPAGQDGALAFEGATNTLAGLGDISNILVNVGGGNRLSVLAGTSVDFTGTLTLFNGGVTVAGGADISPEGPTATVARNSAGAATTDIVGAGSFNGDTRTYVLTIFGGAAVTAASELAATGITTINVNDVGTNYTTDKAATVGDVNIQAGATLGMGNTFDLTVTGTVMNAGLFTRTGGAPQEQVILTGDNMSHTNTGVIEATLWAMASGITVTGTATIPAAPANAALVRSLIVGDGLGATGTESITFVNLQQVRTSVTVASDGTLVIGLVQDDANIATGDGFEGSIGSTGASPIAVANGGSMTFTTNARVFGPVTVGTAPIGTAPTFDFGGNTVFASAALAFTGVSNANFGTAGELEVDVAGTTIGTNLDAAVAPTSALPGLDVDAAASLSSATRVVGATAVDAALTGGLSLTLSGTVYVNSGITNNVTIIGTTVTLAGAETLTGSLTLNAASVDFMGDAVAGNNPDTWTVTGLYTHTAGAVSLAGIDLILNGGLTYVAGTYTATAATDSRTAAPAGDFIQLGGGALTIGATPLVIPNVQIAGATTVVPGDVLTVSEFLWLSGAVLTVSDVAAGTPGTLNLGDSAGGFYLDSAGFTVARLTPLAVDGIVNYGADFNTGTVEYSAATALTGDELNQAGTAQTIGNLIVGAGGAAFRDNTNVTVTTIALDGVLTIENALVATNDSVTLADGGTAFIGINAPFGNEMFAPVSTTNFTLQFDALATTTAIWSVAPAATAWQPNLVIAPVTAGAGTVTLTSNRTASSLSIPAAADNLELGGFTLTVTGGISLASTVNITNVGGGGLTFGGTTAQTLTGGLFLNTVTISNPAGVTLVGGNLNVSGTAAGAECAPATAGGGLTLTTGVLTTGTNLVILCHQSTTLQGWARTSGVVFGNVQKIVNGLPGGIQGAPLATQRVEFPLGDPAGNYRPYAVTFNTPTQLAADPILTATYLDASPMGTNGLPISTVDLVGNAFQVGRYPDFGWRLTSTPSVTPSVDYDVEFRAAGYTNFAGENIEKTRSIRRQDGNVTNFWILTSPTPADNDNYSISATEPVAVGRNAVGAIGLDGVLFTFGLEQNFMAVNPAAVVLNAGQAVAIDLTTVFSGGSPAPAAPTYGYAVATGSAATATGATAADVLTVTGVAAGATTITVTGTDSFGATATATVTVTVNPALAVGVAIDDYGVNVGAAPMAIDASGLFTGGTAPVVLTVATDNAAVATAAIVGTTVTVTHVGGTGSATITVTATDATAAVVVSSFVVTVNAGLATNGTLTNQVVVEGANDGGQSIAAEFANGTGAYTYSATSGNMASATVDLTGTTVTATGVSPYVITGGAVTADHAPVVMSVTATDQAGGSATATYTVDVNPMAGNVSGAGPDPASANLTLNNFLGLQVLTPKQTLAADYDGNGMRTPFDAAQIFGKWLSPKRELVANPMAELAYGDVRVNGVNAIVPVRLTGETAEVVSFAYSAIVDPAFASVASVTSNVEGWTVAYSTSEDGTVMIAGYGFEAIPADGVVATINVTLLNEGTEFALAGSAAVNANAASELGDVTVGELPENFSLLGNYPNPFNPSTTISFDLPASAEVTVQVFDMLGRQVLVLPAQTIQGGAKRSVQLNGSSLASGSYFYRVIAKMDSKTAVENGRMLLVK